MLWLPVGVGVYVGSLCCGSWCPILLGNHLAEEERDGCVALCCAVTPGWCRGLCRVIVLWFLVSFLARQSPC